MQPCLAWFTSEGGGIVKGATMSDELLHGALAFIARVWDGTNSTTIRAGKAGDEHGRDVGQVHVQGKRLAVHLMIQPNYVAAFLGNAEMRAQGTLSRFLAAWPASTVGSRAFREPGSGDRSALDAFHARIGSLLAKPFRVRDRNVLRPRVIRFRKGSTGRAAWIDYYNAVEAELGPNGRLAVVRDVGAKSAEMAARIAAILTLYEDPDAEHVTDAAAVGGCDLARWYLEEARRIAEGSIVDPVLVAAAEVLAWLRGHPEHRTRSGLLVYGPTRLRTKAELDPVLAVLAGHGWIVLPKSGPITVRD
jgi:hypothetical protein